MDCCDEPGIIGRRTSLALAGAVLRLGYCLPIIRPRRDGCRDPGLVVVILPRARARPRPRLAPIRADPDYAGLARLGFGADRRMRARRRRACWLVLRAAPGKCRNFSRMTATKSRGDFTGVAFPYSGALAFRRPGVGLKAALPDRPGAVGLAQPRAWKPAQRGGSGC